MFQDIVLHEEWRGWHGVSESRCGFYSVSRLSLFHTVDCLHIRIQNYMFLLSYAIESSICDAFLERCTKWGFHTSKLLLGLLIHLNMTLI